MQQQEGNPKSNVLGSGVTEELLQSAIDRSGYPLQGLVVPKIVNQISSRLTDEPAWLFAQDEWVYEDPETGKARAVDALIEASIWSWTSGQPRLRPTLNVIVECKQSDLPFVFFARNDGEETSGHMPIYPQFAGLPHSSIELQTDDDPSTYSFDPISVLGMQADPFLTEPQFAVSMSKAHRKGKDLELSGEEAFNAITLPLEKACSHLSNVSNARIAYYSDARLICPVAVVRAPMIVVNISDRDPVQTAVPWVRVVRYEPQEEGSVRQTLKAYDVVHEEYLDVFLSRLVPFAERFSEKLLANIEVFLSGQGFSSGLHRNPAPHYLEPLTPQTRRVRRALLTESIWNFAVGRIGPWAARCARAVQKNSSG